MKPILFICSLLISVVSFGAKTYTIPKDEMVKQIINGLNKDKIYCYNEEGNKFWMFYNKSTILTIKLINNEEKEVMLHSVKYQNGIIEGLIYNVWLPTRKTHSINVDQIESFYIKRKFQESVMVYADIDSSRNLVRIKNDSLKNDYLNREEYIINWVSKNDPTKINYTLREKACYHLVFNDNNHIDYGVVQKITTDSIYISKQFNDQQNQTSIYQYSIKDIKQLSLLKSGGYTYKAVNAADYNFVTAKADKKKLPIPYWYASSSTTGVIEFYRSWLTDRGNIGIMEKDGKYYWYEGN
ncbi:hypothetical protein DVR12_22795 [Chitinophaga silvatica]|uniref:Uncharacterized protein n=1 Tax=Chitinophaga silvatica TaxID=2282649 RepID=A0A3E1Y456_9BACT|nr:hypothetical protein [Chitinophaga silvatica]RFS19465.1 hypothetical protein DVR12_22795 [Chitinophaga silvatica]